MKITGTFNDINDTKSYTVTISGLGDSQKQPTVKDVTDADFNETVDTILFPLDPVHITTDYSDTFDHRIVKSATVNLITNFNLRDLVLANNNHSISMTIVADEGKQTETELFSGYVEPLCFSEPYARFWNEVEITANDKLANSQYIKYPNLILETLNEQDTPLGILSKIAIGIGDNNSTVDTSGLDSDIVTALSTTKISNNVWVGDSQDDWMDCFEVLEQLGKYWGFWSMWDNNKLKLIDWHNMERTPATSEMSGNNELVLANQPKEDFCDDSTSLSNADAYTQIKLECDIDDAEPIVEFGDDIQSPYDHYALYLEELVTEGGGSRALNLFYNLVKNNETSDETDKKHPSESYIYKNFCWIKDSNLWDFGTSGYQYYMYGPENYEKRKNKTLEIKDAEPIRNQQEILNWLNTSGNDANSGIGKGAFVSFGRTDKMSVKDNSPINSIALKDCLIIGVNGRDDKKDIGRLMGQWSDANPICSFTGTSKQFTPPDNKTINYLIISGKILLNKLQAQTGIVMHRKYQKWDDGFGEEYNGISGNLYLDTNLDNNVHTYNSILSDFQNGKKDSYLNKTVPGIGENPYGCYYTHKYYNGKSGNEKETSSKMLCGDLNQTKYNETWKYEYSGYGGDAKKVDNTTKIPILKCQMKIGTGEDAKYCIERADLGPEHFDEFVWMTEEEAKVDQNTQTPWLYFTIGIDPKIDDYIIGSEYDIKNNIWYHQDVDGKGTAIPIKFTDNLSGAVEFKIISPMNTYWEDINKDNKCIYYFLNDTHPDMYNYPILEKLSSIILSDFKIELTSNKGHILNNTANNDLVYASEMNNSYVEAHEDDVKIATMITSDEAAEYGTEMVISDSHVVNSKGSPFFGFPYEVEDEQGNPVIDEETGKPVIAYTKPEELYVNNFYNEYKLPRQIIETGLKIKSYDWLVNPANYKFKFGFLDGEYVPIRYDANLKYNNIAFAMKDMTDYGEQQTN